MNPKWSERAQNDLGDYSARIRQSSLSAADGWELAVTQKSLMAARFPMIGRVVPEFGREDLRELFVHSHRLIYRVAGDEIEVVRVWHGAGMLDKSDLGEEE